MYHSYYFVHSVFLSIMYYDVNYETYYSFTCIENFNFLYFQIMLICWLSKELQAPYNIGLIWHSRVSLPGRLKQLASFLCLRIRFLFFLLFCVYLFEKIIEWSRLLNCATLMINTEYFKLSCSVLHLVRKMHQNLILISVFNQDIVKHVFNKWEVNQNLFWK